MSAVLKTCSECAFYLTNPLKLDEGMCLVEPPKMMLTPGNRGFELRWMNPEVPAVRTQCHLFRTNLAKTHFEH